MIAAAVPPRQLETSAIKTPTHSPTGPISCCQSRSIRLWHLAGRHRLAQLPGRYSWRIGRISQRACAGGGGTRGLSQLELAGRTDISQRHLSFLELGRASPSRDMVMRLAIALDVPLRQHNALLIAAGFAPVWRQTDLAAPEFAQIRTRARLHAGPARAVSRRRGRSALESAAKQFRRGAPGRIPGRAAGARCARSIWPMRWSRRTCCGRTLSTGPRWSRYFIRSVEADAAADGTPETAALLERLLAYEGVPGGRQCARRPSWRSRRCCRCIFAKATPTLRLFTTIATLGIAAGHHAAGASHRELLSDG